MAQSTEDDENAIRLITFLDEAEKRVESFRCQANYLADEKASLIMVLRQLKDESLKCRMSDGDREQFLANTDRLKKRCLSVQVEVNTVRNDLQQEALDKVRNILENTKTKFAQEPEKHLRQLKLYHNSCLSEYTGAVDTNFQNIILECTVDDQKEVRHCLEQQLQRVNNCSTNGKL